MGGNSSTLRRRFPERWYVPQTVEHAEAIDAKLKAIATLKPSDFLQAKSSAYELNDGWSFAPFTDFATETVHRDGQINSLSYRLVPKKISESEFWRLYFCHAHTILSQEPGGILPVRVRAAALRNNDDIASTAVIAAFTTSPSFLAFADAETRDILQRDAEDDEKLAQGIMLAIARQVLPALPEPPKVMRIDVKGRSALEVASLIAAEIGTGPRGNAGAVVVLQGLSGTGKGTTVTKLTELLPNASTWSNGNVFRALTLLAATDAKCKESGKLLADAQLSSAKIGELMSMIKFGKYNGKFDIKVDGHGINALVSEISNTLLKEPFVGKNIPTVAKFSQGEVVKFASAACESMCAAGANVLLEGRAQTLQYVPTPHRFELMLSDTSIIGKRRAAQRMIAATAAQTAALKDDDDARDLLQASLSTLHGPSSPGHV